MDGTEQSMTEEKFIKSSCLLLFVASGLVRPAYVHDSHVIPRCSSFCKTSQHVSCTFSPLDLDTVQRVSDSITPSSPSCGSDWVGANAEGQVESCTRGRSAGVSPVSLPQRSLVDAAWQEAAEALPLSSPDTRCQSTTVARARFSSALESCCCTEGKRGSLLPLQVLLC